MTRGLSIVRSGSHARKLALMIPWQRFVSTATIHGMEHIEGVGSEQAAEAAGAIPADTFAARLVLARHHAGRLSQREAAEACGLNYASWSNWEDGMRPRDRVEVARMVAEGLNMDFNWLLLGGPLLPARGRPTGRANRVRHTYLRQTDHPRDTRPPGGPRTGDVGQAVRRNRVVVRARPVGV